VFQGIDNLFPAILVILMLALIIAVGFNLFRYLDQFETSFGEQLARAAEGADVAETGHHDAV
jgi:hypothetical protein